MRGSETRHLQEQMNTRSVFLQTLRRIWIVPLACVLGGLLGFAVYTAAITCTAGARQYQVISKFYIDFAVNEQTQKAYDYYNAATWDDLLFSHPAISDVIKKNLPSDMTMEEARADVKADILSDIRLMTVTVTAKSADDAAQLTEGIRKGLVQFGETQKEFDKITFLQATSPTLVTVDNRTRNAVLLGIFLGFLISVCALWLYMALDDAVYVPEDAVRRYSLPVLYVLRKSGRGELPEVIAAENAIGLSALAGGENPGETAADGEARMVTPQAAQEEVRGRTYAVISADGVSHAEEAAKALQCAQEQQQKSSAAGSEGAGVGAAGEVRGDRTEEQIEILAAGAPSDAAFASNVRRADCLLLAVRAGERSGCLCENLLAQAGAVHKTVKGIVLTDADGRFLQRYYRAAPAHTLQQAETAQKRGQVPEKKRHR
jgi:capsular polysaccharide biosynthesis protein